VVKYKLYKQGYKKIFSKWFPNIRMYDRYRLDSCREIVFFIVLTFHDIKLSILDIYIYIYIYKAHKINA
jgi:hypothetical protein